MSELSGRAKLILRHITTSHPPQASISELCRLSTADQTLVAAKEEARANARAIEELVRRGLVTLWVVDRSSTSLLVEELLAGGLTLDEAVKKVNTILDHESFVADVVLHLTDTEA